MKPFRLLYQRSKLLMILTILTLALTALTMWEKYNRKQLISSFDTMYADRLIPASEIFHLSNLMYERRRVMDDFMHEHDAENAMQDLERIDLKMDSILHAYEQTYLVDEETEHLPAYKKTLATYSAQEKELLYKEGDFDRLNNSYDKVRGELLALSDIQLKVGTKLAKGHKLINGSMNILDTLQSGMLLILALLIMGLIRDYRSTIPKVRPGNAHLN
jgi:hypothetical protein